MSRRVITHHARHADEGVYRLVYATRRQDGTLTEHVEVVWDDSDPRWCDRELDDVAAEQRQIVKDRIAEREHERESAAALAESATRELGGVGSEL